MAGAPAAEPAIGMPEAVVRGVFRLALPLPGPLGHVNAWLIDNGPDWTILDCGAANAETEAIWDALFAGGLPGEKAVREIIVTHAHSDHVGMAAALVARTGAALVMSRSEWLRAQLRARPLPSGLKAHALDFLASHGCAEGVAMAFLDTWSRAAAGMGGPPPHVRPVRQGGRLRAGTRVWQVLGFGGHSPGQIALHCPEEGIVLAGDVVLPRITPFVGVDWFEPEGDPLAEHLEAQRRLEKMPAETLVLPGHGAPFPGPGERAGEILDHHHERLSAIAHMLDAPATAFEIATAAFPRAIGGGHGHLAFAETLAHLSRLAASGRARRDRTASGVVVYRSRERSDRK